MSEGFYTPDHDITEERNGVTRLLAPAGIPLPMAEAKARGFVKDAQETGPSEVKTTRKGKQAKEGEGAPEGEQTPAEDNA